MDLTTLTEEELDVLRVQVAAEFERRRDLVYLPLEIERLSAKFSRAEKASRPAPAEGEALPISEAPVEAAARGVGLAKEKVAKAFEDEPVVTEPAALPTAEPQ